MTDRILVIGPEVPSNFPVNNASPDVAVRSITKPESQISRLISLAPPHEVIAYLLHVLGFTIDDIASRQNTLHALLEEIVIALAQDTSLLNEDASAWLEPLRRNLALEVVNLPAAGRLVRYGVGLLGAICGETKFQDYSMHGLVKDVNDWIENMKDLSLIARYLGGDEEGFDKLYERHKKRLEGFFAARTRNRDSVQDLCQETWAKLIEKLSQLDPANGCFVQFWRFWARIKLLQFWKKEADYRRFFMDLAEFRDLFPGIENEDEITALVAELPISSDIDEPPSDPDEFNQLLLTTLGGNIPPHQLIAFILVKLLNWKPARVAGELAHIRLDKLVERLETELAREFEPNEGIVHDSFHTLRRIMREQKKLSELFTNSATRAAHTSILDRSAAETCLADYFNSEAAPGSQEYRKECCQNISNWWFNVKRGVLADLLKNTAK